MLDFMIQLMLERNIRFSQADRDECEPLSLRMMELMYLKDHDGIPVLLAAAEREPDAFVKDAVTLAASGLETDATRKILSYMILLSDADGVDLLGKFIVAETALGIQSGLSPYEIHLKLGVMLGKDAAKRQEAADRAQQKTPPLEEFYRLIAPPDHEPGVFEAWLLTADSASIQRFLRYVDCEVLAFSLRGLGTAAVEKIMDNVSPRLQGILIEDCLRPVFFTQAEIADALESISAVLRRLIGTGEVIGKGPK